MKKIVQESLSDEAVLWRYMDLPKFLSLLSESSLWLARSDTFKDKREGIFHQAMKSEIDDIYKSLNHSDIDSNNEIRNSEDFQTLLSTNTYLSCWHQKAEESMVMWEIYGQSENSVAIKTTASKLKESIDIKSLMKDALEVALDEVSYQNHETVKSEQNYRQPFFIKRPHFDFENEVRLYLLVKDKKPRSQAPFGYQVKVGLSRLIEGIYTHPDAENWFYKSVQDLVRKFGLDIDVKKGQFGNKF